MFELDPDNYPRLIFLGLLIFSLAGWLIVEFRSRFGQTLRSMAAWGLIFLGLMAGFGLWQDIRVTLPPRQKVEASGEIRLPRSEDGHYYAQLTIKGTTVLFMVDTGASQVSLSQKDAKRLGFAPDDLVYSGRAQTANGTIRTAQVMLEQVELGPYHDDRIRASVGDGELGTSLLGMSYLDRYEISINSREMVLRR